MKNVFFTSIFVLLLAACSGDEPAGSSDSTTEESAAAEQGADDVATADAESGTDEEALEVVEESAAEPEPEEQAIVLAQAGVPEPAVDFKYTEGTHYQRLMPTQPTVGGADKIEVAEVFWYGCPHCYTLEPHINGWADEKPAYVRFVRIPAMWNPRLVLHARLFYTEEVLGRNGVIKDPAEFREAVFQEYHRRRNSLASEAAIQRFFERFDVSADDFQRTWGSFEVGQKLRVAEDLARRYGIASVPTIIVNGKYRTDGGEAGGNAKLLELIDELVARESAR